MSTLSLTQFQRLCSCSDSTLLWMLKNNKIKCLLKEDGQIVVGLDSVETSAIIEALAATKRNVLAEQEEILAEKMYRSISDHVSRIIDDVLTRYDTAQPTVSENEAGAQPEENKQVATAEKENE